MVSRVVLLAGLTGAALFSLSSAAALLPVQMCPALPVGTSIIIDGIADELVWQDAPVCTLGDAVTGEIPQWITEVRFLHDGNYLYALFAVKDGDLVNSVTGRDASLYQQDVIELFIDPDGDGLYYYEFEWNCTGQVFDALVASAPGQPLPAGASAQLDLSYTAVNSSWAVHPVGTPNQPGDTDSGLVAEIRIAWADLGHNNGTLPPSTGDTLRLNAYRIEYQGPDIVSTWKLQAWSPTGVENFHVPEKFGYLVCTAAPVGIYNGRRSNAGQHNKRYRLGHATSGKVWTLAGRLRTSQPLFARMVPNGLYRFPR